MRTESKVSILTLFFIGLFALGIYTAFRPESYPLKFIRGDVRPVAENVIIGPYPEAREWKKLKEDMLRHFECDGQNRCYPDEIHGNGSCCLCLRLLFCPS